MTQNSMTSEQEAQNTDREIWREECGDFYSNTISVTTAGAIVICVGGNCIVAPVQAWHQALAATARSVSVDEIRDLSRAAAKEISAIYVSGMVDNIPCGMSRIIEEKFSVLVRDLTKEAGK